MTQRPRAFLLPVALAVLFIMMALGLMLVLQGQVTHSLVLGENSRFLDLVTVQEMEARVGASLDALPYQGKPADLTSSNGQASVRWGSGSVYSEPNVVFATYAALFTESSNVHLPRASFTAASPYPLANEHSLVEVELGDYKEDLVYSDLFPYAAYAPGGGVELLQAVSYRNPAYQTPAAPEMTGLPVKVLAGTTLQVADFPYGSAWSEQGPVNVTGGAFARTGSYGQFHTYAGMLESQLNAAVGLPGSSGGAYAQRATDKTHLIRGATLSLQTVVKLIMGQMGEDSLAPESVLSVEQAMTIPLPVIPKLVTRVLWYKLMLHHPYPTDLTLSAGLDKSGEMEPLLQKLSALDSQIKPQQDKVDTAKADLEAAPEDQKKAKQEAYDTALSDLNELQEQRTRLNDDIQETLKENGRLQDELENGIPKAFNPPPSTPEEEANYNTLGWTYFRLIGTLVNLIVELIDKIISGENVLETIMSALFVSTRVVHFSGDSPQFWSAGTRELRYDTVMHPRPLKLLTDEKLDYNCWKGSWNVPPGRTLKLTGNWLFEGDVWLQRGSSLVIEGGLIIDYPGEFKGFDGKPVSGDSFMAKPTGRLVIEPGATLVVKGGKLEISGGDEHNGSITLINPYGEPAMLTSAVLCSGDIVLKYGVHSGVLLGDLFEKLGNDLPNVQTMAKNFTGFLSGESLRAACQAPLTGPYGLRTCWFAEYATTFFIVPLLGPAAGPWPIPQPDGNCMRKVFLGLTLIYTIELNWTLGEYGITMSPIWPFPRGLVPALLKVDPSLVKDALSELPADQVAPTETDSGAVLKEEIPKIVKWLVQFAIMDIVRGLVNPVQDGCANEASLGKTLGEFDKTFAGFFKTLLVAKTMLSQAYMRASRPMKRIGALVSARMLSNFRSAVTASLPVRENGGVLVYAGNNLQIGPDATMACGMFVARMNLDIGADITVGTLMSLYGSIKANKLYHFPYFSRASLYLPKTLSAEAEIVAPGTPEGTETPLVVGRPIYWPTARGWEQAR